MHMKVRLHVFFCIWLFTYNATPTVRHREQSTGTGQRLIIIRVFSGPLQLSIITAVHYSQLFWKKKTLLYLRWDLISLLTIVLGHFDQREVRLQNATGGVKKSPHRCRQLFFFLGERGREGEKENKKTVRGSRVLSALPLVKNPWEAISFPSSLSWKMLCFSL